MPYVADRTIESLFDGAAVDVLLLRLADRMADRLLELVERYTPKGEGVDRPAGTLAESWEKGPVILLKDGRVTVTVFTRREEAPHVEYPTRPHVIRPRADRAPASVIRTGQPRGDETDATPSPALAFYVDGRLVFAREVFHPGTQGSFMMRRAIEQVSREWKTWARRELGRYRLGTRVT